MAYLAMARKWRPKNFEDMVGQDHIAQTIRNAIEGKRISHAYLFTGTRGVGKTTSARILAKALNCKKGPTPVPCDVCENCKAVNNGSSLDVLEIDGASNNGVDNIRELREQANYAPMNGTYKIYVIDEVHMLSKGAFNALLKTLEEPPAHVVFIFATTESNKLPHTILSRVQRFDFKRISEQNIRERLEYICAQESIKPEREALEAIARKADGSMRDALSLFDQVYAFSGADLTMEAARKVLGLPRDTLFDGLLRALIQHDQKTCFTSVQEAHAEGIETSALLIGFGEYLRNMLFARQGVSPGALGLGERRYADLIALAPELRDGDIIRFAKMVSDILALLKNAANPRLAVELGFARMAALDRVVTLSQVLGQDFSPSLTATAASAPAAPQIQAYAAPAGLSAGAGLSSRAAAADLDEVKKKSPREPLTSPAATGQGHAGPVQTHAVSGPAHVEAAAAPSPVAPAHISEASAQSLTATLAPPMAAPAADFADMAEAPDESGFALPQTPAAALSPVQPSIEPSIEEAAGEPVSPYSLPDMSIYESADPSSDPEAEMERDRDLDTDPDDPDAPAPVVAPPAAAVDPDSMTVAVQDAPGALPGVWPGLVAEFMSVRPFLGSHLRHTRLEWDDAETPALRVVFLERSSFSLVGEDADFKKTVQAFLAGKIKGRQDYPLRFSLDEEAAAAAAVVEPVPVAFGGPVDPARREPIINFIRDTFDGRLVG